MHLAGLDHRTAVATPALDPARGAAAGRRCAGRRCAERLTAPGSLYAPVEPAPAADRFLPSLPCCSLLSPRSGFRGHYPTYESAVYGFSSAGELRTLRKEAEQVPGRAWGAGGRGRRGGQDGGRLAACAALRGAAHAADPWLASRPSRQPGAHAEHPPACTWVRAEAGQGGPAGAGAQAAAPGGRRLGRALQRLDLPLHGAARRLAMAGARWRMAAGVCMRGCRAAEGAAHPSASPTAAAQPRNVDQLPGRRRVGHPAVHGGAGQGGAARRQRQRRLHAALALGHGFVAGGQRAAESRQRAASAWGCRVPAGRTLLAWGRAAPARRGA